MRIMTKNAMIKSAHLDKTPQQIINENDITINIVRTRRKNSMSLTIKKGEVRVLVPQRIAFSIIEAFVKDKTDWISQNLQYRAHEEKPEPHRYVEGERFFYLGVERTLKLVTGSRKAILLDDDSITICSSKPLTTNSIKNRLKKWYQSQAQLYLAKRTKTFAALLVVKPRLINTRTYRARWGCCSNKKEITYNWQIVMAPERIIDYVIIHELCHIKQHNHSPAFWALVEQMMPDYKEHKKWLDNNGEHIHF